MKISRIFSTAIILVLFGTMGACCSKNNSGSGKTTVPVNTVTSVRISTDKAMYPPGNTVEFSTDTMPANAYVRYYHLGTVISEEKPASASWSWTPPAAGNKGYMAEIFSKNDDGTETVLGAIGIDVSQDWTKFPRYGFLSDFGDISSSDMQYTISDLNRHHINGIQFYDWQYEHHRPLAGTVNDPNAYWKDIANRNTSMATIKGYIALLHARNMNAMFYDLCYGALSDAASDGVEDSWYLYKDKNHRTKDCLELASPMFKSSIYITDPSNTEWQNYLSGKINDVYSVYDFDGYHIDQLGSRGTLYDYDGNQADLPSGFYSFIKAMKTARPDKSLVMNAVNRYGTSRIAETGNVDFLYNEVWADDSQYSDIKDIIDKNEVYGNGKLRTVMAAYMNYDKAENKGYFNTPGVILADAVIFALGGSHLELGEHMLGKEYFPNDNLKMDGVLQKAMLNYYDFITAYENLLRDGGPFNSVDIDCINGKMSLAAWPPSSGNVTVLAKSMADGTQIIHLINLSKADSFSWRDLNGTMPEPALIKEASVMLKTTRAVKSIWIASPDIDYGVRKTVDFKQNGNGITFTVPSLKYWDMIVIEY